MPHELIVELSLYLPEETFELYCKKFKLWSAVCHDPRFLLVYLASIADVPFTELKTLPKSFFVEYFDASTDKDKFRIVVEYDVVPLFIYWLQDTKFGEEMKRGYRWREYIWFTELMRYLIPYKANGIIRYMMKVYNTKLDVMEREQILLDVIRSNDLNLIKYFLEELRYDYYLNTITSYELSSSSIDDDVLDYLEKNYNYYI